MEQAEIDAFGRQIASQARASVGVIVPGNQPHLYLLVRKADHVALVEALRKTHSGIKNALAAAFDGHCEAAGIIGADTLAALDAALAKVAAP